MGKRPRSAPAGRGRSARHDARRARRIDPDQARRARRARGAARRDHGENRQGDNVRGVGGNFGMSAFPSYSVGTVSVHRGDTAIVGAGGPLWTSTANARAGDDIIIAGHISGRCPTSSTRRISRSNPGPSMMSRPARPTRSCSARRCASPAARQWLTFRRWLGPSIRRGSIFSLIQRSPFLTRLSAKKINSHSSRALESFGSRPAANGCSRASSSASIFEARGIQQQTTTPATLCRKDGTSYVAGAPNTDQAPPDPTFWMVLAAKGDTGAQGPQGTGYAATSTTSLTIGTGPQTFATQAGLAYSAGARARASNGVNYMEGLVPPIPGHR